MFFRFLGDFGVGWPPCRRFYPSLKNPWRRPWIPEHPYFRLPVTFLSRCPIMAELLAWATAADSARRVSSAWPVSCGGLSGCSAAGVAAPVAARPATAGAAARSPPRIPDSYRAVTSGSVGCRAFRLIQLRSKGRTLTD